MATLRFNFGTMGSGKSTMALQIHHNLSSRQLYGLLLTKLDREGAQVTSRLGVAAEAVEVLPDLDLYKLAVDHWPVHYMVCDEVQFYTVKQCDQLGRAVERIGANSRSSVDSAPASAACAECAGPSPRPPYARALTSSR